MMRSTRGRQAWAGTAAELPWGPGRAVGQRARVLPTRAGWNRGAARPLDDGTRASRHPGVRSILAWYAKRTLDQGIAAVALVVLAPVMALVALAIRWESAGPIFYSQVRVGIDRRRWTVVRLGGAERRQRPGYGRPFRIYKLRSMVPNAEKHTGAVWCAEGDPRITRVGRFLRRTHLDEVPQLVNVLRGEMSIVGPRPERPEFVEKLAAEIPGYRQRAAVLPGITGLAQVEHRYDQDLEGVRIKLLYDLHYVRSIGLLFDVKIMAATIGVMACAAVGVEPAPATPPRAPRPRERC